MSFISPVKKYCIVAIQNVRFTQQLKALAACSADAIQRLPWCQSQYYNPTDNRSPFENEVFVCPDFVSLDGMSVLIFFFCFFFYKNEFTLKLPLSAIILCK